MPSIKSRKNGHLSHFPRDAVSDFEPIKGFCLVCRVAFFVLQCLQHVRDNVIDEPEIQIMLHKFNTGVVNGTYYNMLQVIFC